MRFEVMVHHCAFHGSHDDSNFRLLGDCQVPLLSASSKKPRNEIIANSSHRMLIFLLSVVISFSVFSSLIFLLNRCSNTTNGSQISYIIIRPWIFMHLQEILKCKIAQDTRDTKKYVKYSKYNTVCNSWQIKQFSTEVVVLRLYSPKKGICLKIRSLIII